MYNLDTIKNILSPVGLISFPDFLNNYENGICFQEDLTLLECIINLTSAGKYTEFMLICFRNDSLSRCIERCNRLIPYKYICDLNQFTKIHLNKSRPYKNTISDFSIQWVMHFTKCREDVAIDSIQKYLAILPDWLIALCVPCIKSKYYIQNISEIIGNISQDSEYSVYDKAYMAVTVMSEVPQFYKDPGVVRVALNNNTLSLDAMNKILNAYFDGHVEKEYLDIYVHSNIRNDDVLAHIIIEYCSLLSVKYIMNKLIPYLDTVNPEYFGEPTYEVFQLLYHTNNLDIIHTVLECVYNFSIRSKYKYNSVYLKYIYPGIIFIAKYLPEMLPVIHKYIEYIDPIDIYEIIHWSPDEIEIILSKIKSSIGSNVLVHKEVPAVFFRWIKTEIIKNVYHKYGVNERKDMVLKYLSDIDIGSMFADMKLKHSDAFWLRDPWTL